MAVGGLCVSPLWNTSINWDTKDPYITECFKHIVLVVGSCAVLWVVAPFEFLKIRKYGGAPLPWTTLSIAKIVCKVLLLIISTIELIKEIYASIYKIKLGYDGLFAAVAYLVTIILTVILTLMCKKHGLRSSIALPSFWMISTITTVISIYDDIHAFDSENWVAITSLADDSLVFVISLIQLILSNIAETGESTYGRQLMDTCPLDECSFASRLTFSWLFRILTDSTKKSLHHDDLVSLCSEFKSTYVARRFCEIWSPSSNENQNFALERNIQLLENDQLYSQASETRTSFNSNLKTKSLLATLLKISSSYLVLSSILEVLYTGIYFLPVYILSLILNDEKEPVWHKYVYSVVLFVVLLLCTLIDSQRKYYGLASALRVKAAVMSAIFEKALVSQQLQNFQKCIQEHAENTFQMVSLLSDVWGSTFRILIGLYLLWLFLGSASFVGIGTAALFIPISVMTDSASTYFQAKSQEAKSEWLNLLSECLHGIRSLKLYVWEEYFLRKLRSLRKLEIRKLRKTLFFKIMYKTILLSWTSLVSLATFCVFIVMDNSLDLKIIFLVFITIFLLKSPFTNILRLLAHFIQGLTSIFEVQAFLETKEVQSLPQMNSNSRSLIELENTTFTWNMKDFYQLQNISFAAEGNSLIAIVGHSSSGKSSLLRALMGEMQLLEGKANIKGEIAFVSHNSWIQNTTLEENILFTRLKVDSIYRNILESCELLQDIESFPHGEETVIGEKGYSLTATQKLKVELARAVYQNADIFLFDDPFRFIDLSVAKHIYNNVIGHSGILQNKVRIFTTSNVEILPSVDHIIVLKDGNLVEQGNYSDLVEKNGYFSQYLKATTKLNLSTKRKTKGISELNKDICFENFKHLEDPWNSITGLALKAEPENFMQGEIMTAPKAFLRKLVNYLRLNGCLFIVPSILTATIATFCEVASLGWLSWRSSDYRGKDKIYTDLYIYIGLILAQVIFCMICGTILSCGNTMALRKMFCWLLNRIMRAPLTTFGTSFIKRLIHSFEKDLQLSDEEIPVEIFMWLLIMIKAPVIFLTIVVIFPLTFLFFLPLIAAFFIIQRLYMNAWRQLHHLSTSNRTLLFNLLEDIFKGISNIRASQAVISFISRFHTKQDNYNKCNFLFLLISRWLSSSVEIISCFTVLFITIIVLSEKSQADFLPGLLIVMVMQIPECLTAFTYLNSILDIDLSCLERFQSFSKIRQEAEWENKLLHSWPSSGSITIKNLNSTYGEDLYPVVSNINMKVKPGERVAIIGKEDSGISTVLDSLLRFREVSEGEIFIDNVDISSIGLHDLRSNLAVILQDPLVFKGTVRENLDPELNFRDEDLVFVIKTVGLGSHFNYLKNLIDSTLSDEEKYRIAIARGILKRCKIVILDQPENSIGEKYFHNSTVILFGNSCNSDFYDRIIRISAGEMVGEETSD